MTDDVRPKVELESQRERGALDPWVDPAILEQNDQLLASVSAKLGVPVEEGDLIVDVARRLRASGLA